MDDSKIEIIIKIVSSIAKNSDEILPATKIIKDGYIDSLNVFHIMAEVENKFGISIGVMDAIVEDFATPEDILKLIDRVTSASGK